MATCSFQYSVRTGTRHAQCFELKECHLDLWNDVRQMIFNPFRSNVGFGTKVQGYISEWPSADLRYSVAHSLSQTLCPTAGPHCGNLRRAPMALIAAISGGHPWPSLWHYPEGTHGPHCGNIRRASMALIAAISGGHPWPSLWEFLEGTHGPHCGNIRRVPMA